MNNKNLNKLLRIAEKRMGFGDPSHDISHILRVLKNANKILAKEKADANVVLPAVILHDLVTYPKNDSRNKNSVKESAQEAEKLLKELEDYDKANIPKVKNCILCTSFSYGLEPQSLEEKITVDADLLEATGAVSIMRTFSYGGKMARPFYDTNDPFAERRSLDEFKYSLDLFFKRLLKVQSKVHTNTAKQIAKKRTEFLLKFIKQFREEIS